MKKFLKRFLITLALLIAAGALFLYYVLLSPNITLMKREQAYVFIGTEGTYEGVLASLDTTIVIKSKFTFKLTSDLLNYPKHIRAGKYKIHSGMSNVALFKLLRSGKQTPVNLVFNSTRTKEQFAERISEQLEVKKDSLHYLLSDNGFLSSYGLNSHTALTLFIPNTYQFFWNTSGTAFFNRMKRERDIFWNDERKQKASAIGLSEKEITILASIVEQETQRNDEKAILAGVYLNRLKKKMKLDADPTLVFALGDYTVTRVLNEHKQIDSPYNTYKNNGLPPGPICIPSIASIDAVLNRVSHNYLYFCAKDDFSGYHAYASTYEQHRLNARRFHAALNRRGIKK